METEKQSWNAGWSGIVSTITVHYKLTIVVSIALLAVFYVWHRGTEVESELAAVGPIVTEVMGTGTLEARVQATISAKISGRIAQMKVDQGDRISRGQLLVTLDDEDLREQVEVAKAELAATAAAVDRAAAEILSAEAKAKQARLSQTRLTQLLSARAVSEEDSEKANELREIAEAELNRTKFAKVESERQRTRAERSLRYYEARLTDSMITSSFDGLVIRRSAEPGDIVVPGAEIVQIISTEQLWVSAWVDETSMSALSQGQPARVAFRSDPENSYAGTVTRLAPLADRETREFLVDVTVKNLPKVWAVGQRAEVYIETARKDKALLVPTKAIVSSNSQSGVFVNDGGRARWRSVDVGLRGLENTEIIRGLSAGDLVLWPSRQKELLLRDGEAVKVMSNL